MCLLSDLCFYMHTDISPKLEAVSYDIVTKYFKVIVVSAIYNLMSYADVFSVSQRSRIRPHWAHFA